MCSIGNCQKEKPNRMAQDYTVGIVKANIYAIIFTIPIFGMYMALYGAVHGWPSISVDYVAYFSNIPLLFGSIIVGTVLHEVIHAISWSWLDDIPWEKIHFGFKWKMLTPYVHCPVPVEVNNYRWGVAMPGLVLGVLPFLLSVVLQSGWLLGFGFLFTIVAGGDLLMLWLLRNVESGSLVQDHPDLMGCLVINSNETPSL